MNKTPKSKIMLIDGNALVHRGYHAIPVLTTKSGERTNAVYGFTAILLKAIKDLKPTHIACTFDLPGPTFRHKQYPAYKATRVKVDQELYDQIPRVKEVVKSLNIPIYEKPGFEADDLLGTLVRQLSQEHKETAEIIIATGDLDTLQLVNRNVKVYTLRKGMADTAVYDARAVRQRYGLLPSQMVDYKALRGDPSDNIPGVKGIGEKTASGLIKEFQSLDGLYQAIRAARTGNRIKPRILQSLIQQEKQARMSYDLSVINCRVPVRINVPAYAFDAAHAAAAVKLFQTLEFRSLLNKLPRGGAAGKHQTPEGATAEAGKTSVGWRDRENHIGKQDYQLVDSADKLERMLKALASAKEISVDTETTSLDPIGAKLVGIGFCAAAGRAFFVPSGVAAQSRELENFLVNPQLKKTGHNIKYDLQVLSANNLALSPIAFDTMIASYLLNAGTRQHNLDALAFNELGYQMQPIEELLGKGKNQISMAEVPLKQVSWYCCEDVDMTWRLKEVFEPRLKRERLDKIFYDIEMPLAGVLAAMELNGILLDSEFLNRLSGEAEVEIKEVEGKIHELAGKKFNPNSPLQLKQILFDKLKLKPVDNRKTKTGLSTSAENLERMLGQHAIIPTILSYRELAKLQSTYLLALPRLVNSKTGRLHTSYNQTIAATGRLSSTNPNLQNIPVRGQGLGAQVRRAFVAAPGYKLLSLDYSQIELRVVAHLAKDKTMMEVFKKGEDIHSQTAMAIFGVKASDVTKAMRRDAKTINFGILYGLSSFGLSSRIGEVSRDEAKEFIQKYFAAYPAVEAYIEQVKFQVSQEGFVRNELGRVRKFPEIKSPQYFMRAAAERAAVNFPIQSLAADVIKVAMINIAKELKVKSEESKVPAGLSTIHYPLSTECRMLLQVHDELVFEVKADRVGHYARILKPIMEEAISLNVPVLVEAKAGANWGELDKLG